MSSERQNPYPGAESFTEEHSQFFFGRDEEIRHLTSLILGNRIVVFYSQSGAGKTSLLQAKLIPGLRQDWDMEVLAGARVGGDLPPGVTLKNDDNVYVFNTLYSLSGEDAQPQECMKIKSLQEGLAPYLECEDDVEVARSCLLVLDQFEELFSTYPELYEQRGGFFRQLQGCLAAYPGLRLLLSMQEGYIAHLDYYAIQMPDRLRTRFRMQRLDKNQALDAIAKPAREAGRPFQKAAAEKLRDNLRRIQAGTMPEGVEPGEELLGPYVEPLHLSVVCHRLWEQLPPGNSIEKKDVHRFGDVDQTLRDLYEASLAQALQEVRHTPCDERRLRDWFEKELITPANTRGQVYQGEEEAEGVPNAAVAVLLKARLLRRVPRGRDVWYELVHDRLVEPILQANQTWREARQAAVPWFRQAARWQGEGEPDELLLTGEGLWMAERWRQEHAAEDLTRDEERFLERSREARLAATPWLRQAELWLERGEPDELLLGAESLREATGWAEQHQDDLVPPEWRFLRRSAEVLEQAKRERQLARRIRWLAAGATILAIIACFLACVAGLQTYRLGQEGDARLTLQAQHDQTSVAQSDNSAATWAAGATEIATVTLPERATQAAYAVATLTAQVLAASPTPTPTFTPIETPTATASPTRPGETPIPTEPVLSTDTPTPTQTATPDETQAAVQATVHVIQTVEMQLTGEPPTATAQVGDCAYEPQGDFGELWKTAEAQRELGCPGSVYPVGGSFAEQSFEGGRMIWSQIGDQFFVIVYGKQGAGEGTWLVYQSTEIPVINPDGVSCKADTQPPPGLVQPVRGFGGVWCHLDPKTREAIGFATEVERSVTGNLIQQFEAGWVLRDSKNSVYVLFGHEGTYDRGDIVFVPGGELSMGSADDQGQPNEHPRARVGISGFWLDRFEVTNAEYRRCVEAGICSPPHRENDGPIEVRSFTRADYYTNPKFDQFPVLFVSWHDASTYCTWAGKRLPTEAEWEWAAKGRVNYLYPWGNVPEPSASLANYDSNVGDTRAVGQYDASPLGLYDMAGNVWEWTSSLYWDYPYNPKDGREDPTAAGDRVLRGGSWRDGPENLRTANRDAIGPGWSLDNVGFRCAMSTP